ncbi:MAG TPA: cell division protein FtsZ [Chthoniobacteraceae bacterium]|jgi:cell division protein FtsZ|nr:Cell division protein FtsZ [Chthoniobacter sp.]HEV7869023.1 cell division protein FtsZ [Chthoniobacteraceae bacterium]
MIDLQRHQLSAITPEFRIKVVGLGGAGCNALDRLVLDGVPGAELVAMNADAQALAGSVATQKIQLGRTTTRGLGAGGDPEIGYSAAEESLDEVRSTLSGAQMVFLCVGLGGGTGSGGARLIGSVAREHGALVVAFATMPFTFEGRRRMAQAEEALAALQSVSDVVICFDNDRMGDAVSPRAAIQEAFAAADHTISQSVRAIASLATQKGIIQIGFDELAMALRGASRGGSRCLFGSGEADGDNRAHEALERALKCPLMDKGKMLGDAQSVLVNVSGGTTMTLNEVQILMDEFNRHISDTTQILFGTSVDPKLGQKMSVTIISAIGVAPSAEAVRPIAHAQPAAMIPRAAEPEAEDPKERTADISYATTDPISLASPEAVAAALAANPLADDGTSNLSNVARIAAAKKAAREAKQEQMQFEPITRGRFEKSEPTIVDGQDLDVPTFLRRNLKIR